MSKTDAIQTAINRASLMHLVSEDVARALTRSEIHPDLAKVIMTMHHQQTQMDKEIRDLRGTMLTIAHTLAASADHSAVVMMAMEKLAARNGTDLSSLFQPDTTVVSDAT